MSKQEEPTVPKGVRWPADVLRKVAKLARRDKLAFSPEAVELVTRLYDQFGFDTADNSPLSESWRSGPGQPAWGAHEHQTLPELIVNLAKARRLPLR